MEKANNRSVPKSIFVIIVVIFAGMYYYAAFVDSNPEKTVEDFYQAYFSRDYDTVAENLSVFWSLQLLPQYRSMDPTELIKNRDLVEKDTKETIAQIEAEKELPPEGSLKVITMPDYTQKGENSAIVAYSVEENAETKGMELAILINEEGRWRIFSISPVNTQVLEQIQESDLDSLEDNFKNLLGK